MTVVKRKSVKLEWNPFYWHPKGKTGVLKRLAISPSITVKCDKKITMFQCSEIKEIWYHI